MLGESHESGAQWVRAKGIIFLCGGNTKAARCGVVKSKEFPAQGQRSSSACFPSQRPQSRSLPLLHSDYPTRHSGKGCPPLGHSSASGAGAEQGGGQGGGARVGCRMPRSVPAKGEATRPLPAVCARQLHPAPPGLPSVGPSGARKLGCEAELCDGLGSFFCFLEEKKARVLPAWGLKPGQSLRVPRIESALVGPLKDQPGH